MVLIYIRHSNDESGKSSTYEHDAKITKKGKKACQEAAVDLVKKYGFPRVIVTSPFLRARQTAKLMRKAASKYSPTNKRPKIIVDRSLGRFFTHEQRSHPDIRPETASYQPVIDKGPHEMMDRIKKHLNKVAKGQYHKSSKIIWCISHGVIIKKLVRLLGQPAPEEVAFLQTFYIYPSSVVEENLR